MLWEEKEENILKKDFSQIFDLAGLWPLSWVYLFGCQSGTTGHIQHDGCFTVAAEMGGDAACYQTWCTVVQNSHILIQQVSGENSGY